jgi:uncharacterized protein (DUF2062 family)
LKKISFKASIQKIFSKQYWKTLIFPEGESPFKKSLAVSSGVVIGTLPAWGFQTILAISASLLFKTNKPLTLFGSLISVTPALPFLLFFSLYLGDFILASQLELKPVGEITIADAKNAITTYLVGSVPAALIVGSGVLIISFPVFWMLDKMNYGKK